MDDQDVQILSSKIEELRDLQQDVHRTVNDILDTLSQMEKRFDAYYNLSFVLSALREKTEAIDVDSMFGFVDDLETETEALSYNYKRAEKANNISAYRVQSKAVPVYYKPTT